MIKRFKTKTMPREKCEMRIIGRPWLEYGATGLEALSYKWGIDVHTVDMLCGQ